MAGGPVQKMQMAMNEELHTRSSQVWLKHYPRGINKDISIREDFSLAGFIEKSTQKYHSLPAFDCMGTSLSYKEIDRLSACFASFLQHDLGLEKGRRIAIQIPNILQYPVALFGALRAGLVVVNTNPMYTERELKYQLIDSRADVILILENFASKLERVLPETCLQHVIITRPGDLLGGAKKNLVNSIARYFKKDIPAYHLPGAIYFTQALRSCRGRNFRKADITADDTAFLQYTGGTTGISKGAQLTHRNILANIDQLSHWLSVRLNEGEEVAITPLPLYHIYALVINCFVMMKIGARNILVPDPRNLKSLFKTMRKYRFTLFTGINTLFNNMMKHPEFAKMDFSGLKISSAGGMALQSAVANEWMLRTGTPISEGYGLTETSPVLTSNIPLAGWLRPGSIGLPLPGTLIRIADDYGTEVPYGTPGEIQAKGPQIMKGYWNRPEETREAFTSDGWFKTGDIGIMEPDGFCRMIDRKKEMINVSGFNVFPTEVEEVVARHNKVLEVGAVGVPDAHSTEAVKIFVVKKDRLLTYEELFSHCRKYLAAYKVPRHIEFCEGLPKSTIGKVLRKALKENTAPASF